MIELFKALILPSHSAAILLFVGLLLFAIPQLRRKGQFFLIAGASIYLVFSNGIVAAGLIGPLEYKYPPLLDLDNAPSTGTVVVLTSFATDDPSMPLSSHAGTSAVYRVLEASRLYASGNATEVLVSGDATAARIMAKLLSLSGIPESDIIVDGGAVDTLASARRATGRISSSTVFLVTSAGHMPRAVNSFLAAGIKVVPAPTDHKMPVDALSASALPSGFHLEVSDHAIHEYAALLWYGLSGKTPR